MPWALLVGIAFVMPCHAALDQVQVHVLAIQPDYADQSLPAVTLVPLDLYLLPGHLAPEFPCCGLAPGLVPLGRIDTCGSRKREHIDFIA